MTTVRLPCPECKLATLPATLDANGGLCVRCARRKANPYGLPPDIAARAVPVPPPDEAARIQSSRLERLDESLRTLLNAELALGNGVVETAEDWPKKGSIFVMLGRPFSGTNQVLPDGVRYTEINDPHYWKAQYSSEASGSILACRFSGRAN